MRPLNFSLFQNSPVINTVGYEGLSPENSYYSRSLYNRHNEAVNNYFRGRGNKLLTLCWENGDRWEKLAMFPGLPVPDKPFPHKNRVPWILKVKAYKMIGNAGY